MDDTQRLLPQMIDLGLSADEARIYIELLRGPSTPLQLSRHTNIPRTTVYRLIDQLEKRSLLARHSENNSAYLVATDPTTLEVILVSQEAQIKQQRQTLQTLLPALSNLRAREEPTCSIRTYEGEEGLRQMIWHELKTKGELLAMGGGAVEEFVSNSAWSEKHRALSVEAGYRVREISNEPYVNFTSNKEYLQRYTNRVLPKEVLNLDNQCMVYNDTVAFYHWRQKRKVGVEIINPAQATLMRQIFEQYWQLAQSYID